MVAKKRGEGGGGIWVHTSYHTTAYKVLVSNFYSKGYLETSKLPQPAVV